MIALRLGIRSVMRQGWRVLQIMAPTTLLFGMLAFVLATETVASDLVKKGVTERTIRLGSVDGYATEAGYFTQAEINHLSSIPGVRATGANFLGCYIDDHSPREFTCAAVSRVYLEARDYAITEQLLADWEKVKNGAIICGAVAIKHHWKVGDHITLKLQPPSATPVPVSLLDVIVTGIETKATVTNSILLHNEFLQAAVPVLPAKYWVVWMMIDKADQRRAIMDQIDGDLNSLHRPHTLWRGEDTSALILNGGETVHQAFLVAGVLSLMLVVTLSATMLLVSIERRKTQFATLIALGFRRAVLVRSVFVESILMMFSSAAIGAFTMYLLFHNHPFEFDVVMKVKVSLDVALITAIGGGVLSILTSLLPAWRLYRIDVLSSLR
jgi:hypothetical protein